MTKLAFTGEHGVSIHVFSNGSSRCKVKRICILVVPVACCFLPARTREEHGMISGGKTAEEAFPVQNSRNTEMYSDFDIFSPF